MIDLKPIKAVLAEARMKGQFFLIEETPSILLMPGWLASLVTEVEDLREEVAECQRDGDQAVKHLDAGMTFERVAIVQWLRRNAEENCAQAIEAGEHHK